MENKLQVKDLRISFRTVSGKVQAVRGISFDLKQGETLAIVGESGSGKSVTSKAILGILAGNSIIEGGEILYDSMDLLKISEDEFYKIRGDKIAMIFQDPLSSLNPIMRIGRQLTEAMLLKGKVRQKNCRNTFNTTLSLLEKAMTEAIAEGNSAKAAEIKAVCKNFDKFEIKHVELEQAYNEATEASREAIELIDDILFLIEKNALKNSKDKTRDVVSLVKKTYNDYVVAGNDAAAVKELVKTLTAEKDNAKLAEMLADIKKILEPSLEKKAPNFFRMGYYLTFANQPLPEMDVDALNEYLLKYLNDNFMLSFLEDAKKGIVYSANIHNEKKAETVQLLKNSLETFSKSPLNKKECDVLAKALIASVKDSIDRLDINKDTVAYTFDTSLNAALDIYFNGIVRNASAKKAHDKQQAKYDALVKKGKTPEWDVIPLALVDLDAAAEDIKRVVTRLIERYETVLAEKNNRDYDKETVALVDFFMANASGSVYKVTKAMAKHKAIRLMEEVGIPEPKRRYRQYPFEFSGGMRQRIVIAIALAANPDILICDEPTTALDVTIQAQILELINKIKEERKLSIIFITHDLGVVANMADKIAVMYAGKIVEYGTSEDIFYSPAHPYTWALLSSMPDLDTNEKLEAIPGTPPNMIYPPVGDAFADRNKYALKIDFEQQPPMFDISETHRAATWLLHPDAPKVDPPKIILDRVARMKQRGEENNG